MAVRGQAASGSEGGPLHMGVDPNGVARAIAVRPDGSLVTALITTAPRSDVAVAVGSTLVLAANSDRKPGSVIVCDTTAISYFKLGTGASPTDFFAAIDSKSTVPGIFPVPDGYTGVISGYGSVASGTWRVTEMA